MLERLVEGWLDSASERSYQSPFCQALLAKGHRVIHSTRHAPLELGKDVVSIDSEGRYFGYQLKGSPGARLTLTEFRTIREQLHELATQPLRVPGSRVPRHTSVLVTNGYVDEEVQIAIQEMNQALRRQRAIGYPLKIIQRGDLLDDFLKLGASLWPSELEDLDTLLRLLNVHGRDALNISDFASLMEQLLALNDSASRPSQGELERRVTSASLLVAFVLRAHAREENHVARLQAWTLFFVQVVGAYARWNHKPRSRIGAALDIARYECFRSIRELFEEAASRERWIEQPATADVFLYRWREALTSGLLSAYWLIGQRAGGLSEEDSARLREVIPERLQVDLWGEAAIPQLLGKL